MSTFKNWGQTPAAWGLTPVAKIVLAFTITLCCVSASFAKEFRQFIGEINDDGVNLRADSRVNSELILKLNKGNYVSVVAESYGWYKIKLPKLAPSYVKKTLVVPLSPRAIRIAKDTVNIRLGPAESSAILGKAHKGEIVSVVDDRGDWYRIEPVDTSFGWIHKRFVNEITDAQKLEAINAAGRAVEPSPPIAAEPSLQAPGVVQAPGSTIVVEGVIKPYGRVFRRVATHKLIKNDNTILLLKGNKKALDAVTYHRVRISGKSLEQSNQKYPVIEIEKVETLD